MKVLLGLLVLCGALFAILYYTDTFSFDPKAQAREAKAAIKAGMPWDKVITAAKPPKEYRVYIRTKKTIDGQEIIETKLGPANPFNKENLASRLKDGSLPDGFVFTYNFAADSVFHVNFDGNGDVINVQDDTTIRKLFDM